MHALRNTSKKINRFLPLQRLTSPRRRLPNGVGGRTYSAGPGCSASGKALSPLFTGVLVFGLGVTAYGIYGLYDTLTMWPPEIKPDLRSGLLAKRKDNLEDAAAFLARAWESTKRMSLEAFGSEPLLKTTGVAISLAGILEESKQWDQAYEIYKDALRYMANPSLIPEGSRPAELNAKLLMTFSVAERVRAISIAYRLGELAQELKKPLEEEEKWLSWAVEALLKTVLQVPRPLSQPSSGSQLDVYHRMEDLELPSWDAMQSLAAPFEALGSFYSRTGKIDFAMPLYLHAVSILIPSDSYSSPEDRCKGAQLMGNIAELVLRINPGKNLPNDIISQAESWTRKGLETTVAARKEAGSVKHAECEVVYAALLYNFGMIRELAGDKEQARKFLNGSLKQAKAIGMQEGIDMVQEGLKDLEEAA
ncbi:hypothetical protein CPB83DRAFT_847069 [Crepidotus variabilis]|uniref:Uncharacterized protein n=1 Tax=Crepidotus variabilis TaxID=179855 RepID=A0A9P6EMT0_9AGAR|nr:hypothetical protein CPB83DRAFT_847069 [Crepidotus variabilis]